MQTIFFLLIKFEYRRYFHKFTYKKVIHQAIEKTIFSSDSPVKKKVSDFKSHYLPFSKYISIVVHGNDMQ